MPAFHFAIISLIQAKIEIDKKVILNTSVIKDDNDFNVPGSLWKHYMSRKVNRLTDLKI